MRAIGLETISHGEDGIVFPSARAFYFPYLPIFGKDAKNANIISQKVHLFIAKIDSPENYGIRKECCYFYLENW